MDSQTIHICITKRFQVFNTRKLILDLLNPSLAALTQRDLGVEFGEEKPFEMPDGRRVRRTHVVTERDLHQQVMRAELIYYVTHPDGRQERLVHAFWPLWSILIAVAAALMLGLHEMAPVEVVWTIAVLAGLGALYFAVQGWRRFRWPSRAAAVAAAGIRAAPHGRGLPAA